MPDRQALSLWQRKRAVETVMLSLIEKNVRVIAIGYVSSRVRTSLNVSAELADLFARTGEKTAFIEFDAKPQSDDKSISGWLAWPAFNGVEPIVETNSTTLSVHSFLQNFWAARDGHVLDMFANPANLRANITKDFNTFDRVICSVGPFLQQGQGLANPYAIAAACDGAVVSCDATGDDLDSIEQVSASLQSAGARFIGTILDRTYAKPHPNILSVLGISRGRRPEFPRHH